MLRVGLTGGLASGKTFVATLLENHGCHVIHADRIGHEVLLPDGEAYAAVVREFGCDILQPDGRIDRKLLGKLVFSDAKRLETLNSLVHPHVFRREEQFFARVAAKNPAAIAVVEAAIMIEVGSYQRYDRLIVVWCTPEQQIERFRKREDASEADARARLERQMPLDAKRKFADYVIDTSGTKDDTASQVEKVYEQLRAEASAKPLKSR
jgi:dephospho-CoA kinase